MLEETVHTYVPPKKKEETNTEEKIIEKRSYGKKKAMRS
jgi:hypothetical protein